MNDPLDKSKALFKLYEGLPPAHEEPELADLLPDKSLEAGLGASQWQLLRRKFIRNKVAIVGAVVVLLYYLCALFAGFLAPYTLSTRLTKYIYMPPQPVHFFSGGRFQPFVYEIELTIDKNLRKIYRPERTRRIPLQFLAHGEPYKLFGLIDTDVHLFQAPGGIVSLLGTDRQGRDMFSRILYGSQISLTIGLMGVLFSLLFGSVLGVASGYYGGWVDNLIQRLIELVRSFPSIPLWMALSAAVPPHWPPLRTYFVVTLILSLIGWTWLARQLRGKVLALRSEDFVLAAKLAGASDARIIFRHLIPATFGHIIVVSTLAMPAMILAETALSFLGLGLRPPITSWGVLLQEAQNLQSIALYPWVFTPAAAIALAILAFNFLGDGLRDASDPYTI
jgi:peptide/nickel transport system permease protein